MYLKPIRDFDPANVDWRAITITGLKPGNLSIGYSKTGKRELQFDFAQHTRGLSSKTAKV